MALTDRRPTDQPVEASGRAEPRGFRPASRRRTRIAAGAVLAAIAIGGNVLLYTSLDDKTEVLQLVNDVRAGEVVTSDDLRIVEADLDPTVPAVAADDIALVVNQYARVFLPSGSLIFDQLVQSTPLVSDGAGVVAVELRPTQVPAGLTTRSQVLLVIVREAGAEPFVTRGRVVRHGGDATEGADSALSVEVSVADASTVAAADDVRVVLVEPGVDAATEQGAGG
ncbi:SAF domain-containing protein [Ilumatobacter sp.]|uniref:SAF domain-containing protein n=1 Tax=Ilumatobacter sp. TaxID=1967498 RepID=UPI003AF6D0E3